MSRELQPLLLLVSVVKIELPRVIKNEPPESEIGIDDILDSSETEEKIISDLKDVDIVYHPVCEGSIKSEILESYHCESVETQVSVKVANSPFIKTENITQRNKAKDTSNEIVTKGTGQAVLKVEASNEHSNALSNLEIDEQSVLNFSKDYLDSISARSRKSKSPKKTNFAESYKTDDTTLWKKEKERIKVIKAPVIPVEAHEYTSLAKGKHICNHCQHTCNTLSSLKRHIDKIHRKVTTMYQCPYCTYKSKWKQYIINQHIIQKHKDTKDIKWFQCNLCEMKFKLKKYLTQHMKVHLKHKQMQDGLDLREKRELQPAVLSVSLLKIEPATVIKNEPPVSEIVEIGIDDILDSSESEEKIIPDVKGIDIVYHPVCQESIKSEILESYHYESVETQGLVKAENSPFIKTENITQRNKTKNTSDENVTKSTGQAVVEVQGSNDYSSVISNIETDTGLNSFKDLNGIIGTRSRKAKHPEKIKFAKCYKTVETISWEKDKEKIKVIKAPVILVEAHEYTSLAKDRHVCNHCQYACNKLNNLKRHIKRMHREVTTMYQCPYCPFKSIWSLKKHIIQKHKDIKDIQWFQCNVCEKKFKLKGPLTQHMKVHF